VYIDLLHSCCVQHDWGVGRERVHKSAWTARRGFGWGFKRPQVAHLFLVGKACKLGGVVFACVIATALGAGSIRARVVTKVCRSRQ
jgi:hypothetical protein